MDETPGPNYYNIPSPSSGKDIKIKGRYEQKDRNDNPGPDAYQNIEKYSNS